MLIGILVLLLGFDQPIVLLVISAVTGGFMMFMYSGLLILINRKMLPGPIQIRGVRSRCWSGRSLCSARCRC